MKVVVLSVILSVIGVSNSFALGKVSKDDMPDGAKMCMGLQKKADAANPAKLVAEKDKKLETSDTAAN